MDKVTVLKIGGSILSLSDEELFSFSKANEIKGILAQFIEKGDKFICVVGGGYVCRKYQKSLKDNGYTEYDEHFVGAAINNVNALMLRAVFGELADKDLIAFKEMLSDEKIVIENSIQVGGGGIPGVSGDWDTVRLAIRSGAKEIVSVKDIDGVYTADPKKDPSATKLDKVTWDEYLNIIGNPSEHTPGGNFPVDPVAARLAKENGIKFHIISGKDLNNLKRLLDGDYSVGTVIS